jgi:hypothetical protein
LKTTRSNPGLLFSDVLSEDHEDTIVLWHDVGEEGAA